MALPDGWVLRVSRSKGKVFYVNTRTQQTQWTRPTEAAGNAASTEKERSVDVKKRKREEDEEEEDTSADKAAATKSRAPTVDPEPVATSAGESERRMAIARCMRVGASSNVRAFAPWEHQVDAVDKLLDALLHPPQADGARANRFLLQHSTGSGKTVTIGALAHQLLYFHDAKGHRFHTVVLLIDRIQLDEQVGDSVERFLRRNGLDAIYRATSIDHLAGLLTSPDAPKDATAPPPRQRVIITTIQKIGLLAKNAVLLTRLLRGNIGVSMDGDGHVFSRIAIITDEAHRSHTAATRQTIEAVIAAGDENTDNGVTFVGFTATPNAEALRLFGSELAERDVLEPFHCYAMARAVADARIVDVLQNYTCVRCELEVSIPFDVQQQLVATKSMRTVMEAASDDIDVLKAKSAYMMTDFARARGTWNRAKCMIVTRSRRDVVRYYELITTFLQNKQSSWRVFAVFSGTVTTESSDGAPRSVTEQSLNPKHLTLAGSDIVVVCDKLDTGYSDPLLSCMYIDRYLRSSVQTVQLLSRLNRHHMDKRSVRIVDFANHAAQIRRHFATFWHEAKMRSQKEAETMPEADWRTTVSILSSALMPDVMDLRKSELLRNHVEVLERTLDRDAFQQVFDAVRLGVSTWGCMNDRSMQQAAEAMSPVSYHHLSSMKKWLEGALCPTEGAALRADDVVRKMKTRVRRYEIQFSGQIYPGELHSTSKLRCLDKSLATESSMTAGLLRFERLLAQMAKLEGDPHATLDISNRQRNAEDPSQESDSSTEISRLDQLSTRLAAHINRDLAI